MRSIHHPGTPVEPRVASVRCRVEPVRVVFQSGKSVLDAVTQALEPLGIESAVVEIAGGAFDPLVYVMPAASTDGVHAAWYSETHAPAGRCPIESLTFTFGRRDGTPFIHCHGIWRHADGSRNAGHLMPGEARFAEPVEARVFAISGAILDQLEDDETRFRLFTPVAHGDAGDGRGERGILCRIKPNEEINAAIERAATAHGIGKATIHGIGSLVGCRFSDGQVMESFASELFIREGRIDRIDGRNRARLDIAIVDVDGGIFEGEIVPGINPVCVTCELLIVGLPD